MGSGGRGRVRLAAETRNLEGEGSHEWIELHVPLPETMPEPRLVSTLKWVVQARNACIVWHMLACCPGFEGHEHEVFWKKLIEHIKTKNTEAITEEEYDDWWQGGETVCDARKFFPSWSKKTAFPRFRLHIPTSAYLNDIEDDDLDLAGADDWVVTVLCAFIGLRDPSRSELLAPYRSQLYDFIDFDKCGGFPVEIGVRLGSNYPLEDLADTLRDTMKDIEEDALSRQKEQLKSRLVGQGRFPFAKITQVCLCDRDSMVDGDTIDEATDLIRLCHVFIPAINISPNEESTGADALRNLVNGVSRYRDDGSARVDTFRLDLHDAAGWQVEALFSAIPITGVCTLEVTGSHELTGLSMDHHTWTWLAYAVYHPWLLHTSLHLNLDRVDISENTAGAMKGALAAQRHLYRLIHGEDDETLPENDLYDFPRGRYTIVDVSKGTRCFSDASLEGSIKRTFSVDIMLTAVVKFNVFDIKELPDVVCVVVPGDGVAWISKTAITGLARPYADHSHISGVRLGYRRANPSMQIQDIHQLVRAVSTLDIAEWRELKAAELMQVLEECYRVSRLRVSHQGDLFHIWTEADDDKLYEEFALDSLHVVVNSSTPFVAPSQAA